MNKKLEEISRHYLLMEYYIGSFCYAKFPLDGGNRRKIVINELKRRQTE